jgi:CheY-like chemotaxis protein
MAQAALSLSGPTLSSPLPRRPRLLYAEDQATSRIVTTAMLQRMGYDVDAVDDGDVAVDRARNGQ